MSDIASVVGRFRYDFRDKERTHTNYVANIDRQLKVLQSEEILLSSVARRSALNGLHTRISCTFK